MSVVKGWETAGGVAGFGRENKTPGDGLPGAEARGPLAGLDIQAVSDEPCLCSA